MARDYPLTPEEPGAATSRPPLPHGRGSDPERSRDREGAVVSSASSTNSGPPPSRRDFAAGLLGASLAGPALLGMTRKAPKRIDGGFVFEDQERGHKLRDHTHFPAPKRMERAPVVIVGGGIAGLSAGWWLQKRNFHDFVLLELGDHAGGNARWGENSITPFPWAAHYLPVPGKRATLVRELCEELGLLKDGVWDERWLCHSQQERLFINGHWQEGIEPQSGLAREDLDQFQHFADRIREMRDTGAFRVPSEDGSAHQTAATRELDRITFGDWMRREGLYSPYLRWYLDYCTRDDYGASAGRVSAWAGVHYFASREPDEKGPLTWPEGNGWIARRLIDKLAGHIHTGSMVHHIRPNGRRWHVFTEGVLWDAEAVIFAAPMFLASWMIEPPPPAWPVPYAPWLVANLTLDRWPKEDDSEPAWDNVVYESPTLGYVVATHQNLGRQPNRTVWTFYWALAGGAPADMRRVLLGGDWKYWSERILQDLERAHPDIRDCVSRIDINRLGHAMPSPVPGSIFHAERLGRARPRGSLVYAHSDLSALPLFEEAQYRGVTAARHVLRLLGRA
jgi:glycine/D-amino acid oxidase-like deaminating enzyme